MALITPEYLHNPKYEAKRDRAALQHGGGVQGGVWNAGDFKATQRSGSANMSVDVAAGYALVAATNAGNLGLYHVQNDATVNVVVTPSHATLPRIDQVYLLVNDSTDGGAASDVPQLLVAAGNPVPSVTLDAPGTSPVALPNNSLKLADLLIPPNSDATGVVTANIRDRRPWARGGQALGALPTGASIVLSSGPTPLVLMHANLSFRLECTGLPLEIEFAPTLLQDSANGNASIALGPAMDGALIWPDTNNGQWLVGANLSNNIYSGTMRSRFTPPAGSHTFELRYGVSGFNWNVGPRSIFRVVEDMRPSVGNT